MINVEIKFEEKYSMMCIEYINKDEQDEINQKILNCSLSCVEMPFIYEEHNTEHNRIIIEFDDFKDRRNIGSLYNSIMSELKIKKCID
jgi:hypothetical protein